MDSFSFHNRKLQRITILLRFVEVCVVLVLVSRLPLHLPVAVKNSGEYLREFSVFVNSPRFVFLIGNVIVMTLLVQSGLSSRKNDSQHDLYQEFLQKSTKNQRKIKEKQSKGTEEKTEYPEKNGIRAEDSIKNRRINENMTRITENNRTNPRKLAKFSIRNKGIFASFKNKWSEKQSMKTGEVKDYRRCQTEIIGRVTSEKEPRGALLRRCETEKSIVKSIEAAPPPSEEEEEGVSDDMSNEEFRRTVEAFIAKQQRIRREEEEDHSSL